MAEGIFTDSRVFVCRPESPELARHWDQRGGFEQVADGPTYVVIGKETSDAQCDNFAMRFGMEPAALIAYRDNGSSEGVTQ